MCNMEIPRYTFSLMNGKDKYLTTPLCYYVMVHVDVVLQQLNLATSN